MKRKFLYVTTAIVLGVLVTTQNGCKKIDDFGNLNVDPGSISQPITAALLTNVLSGLGSNIWDGGRYTTNPGLYCQYFTETQYTEEARYATPTFEWSGLYAGALYDLQNIINYNSDAKTKANAVAYGSNANQIAVARILKAYLYWLITDQWGDIPYKGALKGKGEVPYDKQSDIYTDLMKELKEANAQFDGGDMPKGDILYGGNQAAWKKFANSLRLLMALRLSKADPVKGKTEFAAVLSDPAGVIESNSDNAALVYPGGNFLNPIYNYYVVIQRKDYAVTNTFLDWLTSHNDNRSQALASSTIGFPYGLPRDQAITFNNANPNWARVMSPGYRTATSPMYILTASQVWLARAEAAVLGWTSEVPITAYTNGIQASWQQWNVYDYAQFAAYTAQADVALTGTPQEMIRKIAIQEWIAAFPDGKQGWAIWRKTGYPQLTPAPGTTTIPRRFPYPPTESGLNSANWKTAAQQYKLSGVDDSQFARVWWDQ